MKSQSCLRAWAVAFQLVLCLHAIPLADASPFATLVIRNETDATLVITVFRYSDAMPMDTAVPPRRTMSFPEALLQSVDTQVEAAPACVRGVGGVAKPLIITSNGRYEVTFTTRDFGKQLLLDAPNCAHAQIPNGDCYAEINDCDIAGLGGRVLGEAMIANDEAMTVDKCVYYCADKNFAYAGVQYGKWCFCGNAPGKKIDPSACSMPCAGNGTQTCGGAWANSVYSVRHYQGAGSAPPVPAPPAADPRRCPSGPGYNAYGCGI